MTPNLISEKWTLDTPIHTALHYIENKIYKATKVEFMQKVQDTLGHVTAENGGINTHTRRHIGRRHGNVPH